MNTEQQTIQEAVSFLPDRLRFPVNAIENRNHFEINELRLRRLCPVMIQAGNRKYFLRYDGTLCDSHEGTGLCIVENYDMDEAVRRLCNYSVHAFQSEMKNGFITVKGGHRVGICASAVTDTDGGLCAVRNVSSLNIRVAREINGAANEFLQCISDSGRIKSALIVGEPASGKTTVLRDAARRLSGGDFGYMRVCIVDERSEIAATNEGIARKRLGVACDVLDGYPKADGMMIALRAMAPEIIMCDEIGSDKDVAAIESVANSGVRLVATMHADSFSQLMKRPQFTRLMKIGLFETAVILSGREEPGKITETVSLKKYWR